MDSNLVKGKKMGNGSTEARSRGVGYPWQRSGLSLIEEWVITVEGQHGLEYKISIMLSQLTGTLINLHVAVR